MAGDWAYLAELRKLWQQNFVAAILVARLNHERIPPETAAVAQRMDSAFRADRDISDAAGRALGTLGIFGGGHSGLGTSYDPDEYMFNAAMGLIAAHRGNPPAAPELQAQAARIVTGQLDPVTAFELSSPELAANAGLLRSVLALAGDMAPLVARMGLFVAALAVPADAIPALLHDGTDGRPPTTGVGAAPDALAGSYGARSRTSSLAVASMALGIGSWLGFSLLSSIPAIITGHMARREIREGNGAVEGGGLALIGLITGYANAVFSIVYFRLIMSVLGAT